MKRAYSSCSVCPPVVLLFAALSTACNPFPVVVGQGWVGSAVLDGREAPHVLYTDGLDPWYGVIADSRMTGAEAVPFDFGNWGPMALDRLGNPHALAMDEGDLVHVWKASGAWQSEVVVTGLDWNPFWFPSLVVGADDTVHASYVVAIDPSTFEIHYAKREGGSWTSEPTGALFQISWCYLIRTHIGLAAGGLPVIATAAGGNWFMTAGEFEVVVSEKDAGGSWSYEQVAYGETTAYESYGISIDNFSLAVAPSGTPAVSLVASEGWRGGWWLDGYILEKGGSGWEEIFHLYDGCSYFDDPCAVDCQSLDIAYDAGGSLLALFSREQFVGTYPDYEVVPSISLARHGSGTAWQEKNIWNASVVGEMYRYAQPYLLAGASPIVRVVYNDDEGNIYYLEHLATW